MNKLEKTMLEHLHLLVQGTMINPLSKLEIENFILNLIQNIDMDIIGGPHVYRSDIAGNEGFTTITAITTSHVVMHTWDTGLIQLDVYSCKNFNIQDIIDMLSRISITDIKFKFLDRSNGFKTINNMRNIS
jgi:S-adenosylmethionine/arginine decarboxylase-like enzyme